MLWEKSHFIVCRSVILQTEDAQFFVNGGSQHPDETKVISEKLFAPGCHSCQTKYASKMEWIFLCIKRTIHIAFCNIEILPFKILSLQQFKMKSFGL